MGLFLKNLVFTVLVPGTVAGYLPCLIGSGAGDASPLRHPLAASPLFIVGGAIYLWCVADFARARGTPAPIDPPKDLVIRGLYRYVRNPMYLGVLSAIAGWAVYYQQREVVGYFVLIAVLFHLVVLVVEEPSLRRLFGASYQDYSGRVNRWIPTIPRATR